MSVVREYLHADRLMTFYDFEVVLLLVTVSNFLVMKKALRETQTLRVGFSKAEPKISPAAGTAKI